VIVLTRTQFFMHYKHAVSDTVSMVYIFMMARSNKYGPGVY
jgi:hypothetical protein